MILTTTETAYGKLYHKTTAKLVQAQLRSTRALSEDQLVDFEDDYRLRDGAAHDAAPRLPDVHEDDGLWIYDWSFPVRAGAGEKGQDEPESDGPSDYGDLR